MIVNTEPFHKALTLLKRTTGSEMENPFLVMYSSKGRLHLASRESHISTLIKVPVVGEIKPVSTLLNPIYYFTKNIKSKAIEITGSKNLTLTSLGTQENLVVPAVDITPEIRPVYHAGTKIIRTSSLLHALDRVSLPLQEEDVIAITANFLSGYSQNIITSATIPISDTNGLLPYAPARRLIKLLKLCPENLQYTTGMENHIRFTARNNPLEIEITVSPDALIPSELPAIPAPQPSFYVETQFLYHRLRRLSLITKGIPTKTLLHFDGLNLHVTTSNSHLTSSFSISTRSLSFNPAFIPCRLRPLLSFVSAVRTTRKIYFCISEKTWLLKNNLALMAIISCGVKNKIQ